MVNYLSGSDPNRRKPNGKPCSILIHRRVWENAYGKIPKGHIIHHKDFNKLNNKLDNLECISRTEHRLKHFHNNKNKGVSNGIL